MLLQNPKASSLSCFSKAPLERETFLKEMDWCSFGLKERMKPCAGNVQSLGNTHYQKLYRVEMKVQKPKDIKTPSDTPTLIDRKEEGVPLHSKNIGYL